MDLDIAFAEATTGGLLGAIGFGRMPAAPACPTLAVATRALGSERVELWTISGAVRRYEYNGFAVAQAGDLRFGTASFVQAGDLRTLAREVYAALFRTVGNRSLVRVHNYLPRITATEGGTERYRLFNEGRHEAFAAAGRSAFAAPAATGVGIGGELLQISFLATAAAMEPVENPRQVSAYAYPERYGRSPTFSRATILRRRGGALLFLSGTASIVGHESLHPRDAGAQAREAWRNVEAVLAATSERGWRAGVPQAMKVYLRERDDEAAVRHALADQVRTADPMFLHAPLCRDELLVELEAVFALRRA